jgi:hypothetical protein
MVGTFADFFMAVVPQPGVILIAHHCSFRP